MNKSPISDNPKLIVIEAQCWKCKQPMKVAVMDCGSPFLQHRRPDEFTKDELLFAATKGVSIKLHYSATADYEYLANSCTHCDAFVGDHYLFTDYIQPADMGDLQSTSYEMEAKDY
ncbi:MAG: hypothetical protein P4L41_02035 [Flavipsychrobacter sp.]|nr:hypothetical protein [Flavipsychrobacter sp.]